MLKLVMHVVVVYMDDGFEDALLKGSWLKVKDLIERDYEKSN